MKKIIAMMIGLSLMAQEKETNKVENIGLVPFVDEHKVETNKVMKEIAPTIFWTTNITEETLPQLFVISILTTNRIICIVKDGNTNYIKGDNLGPSITNFIPIELRYEKRK